MSCRRPHVLLGICFLIAGADCSAAHDRLDDAVGELVRSESLKSANGSSSLSSDALTTGFQSETMTEEQAWIKTDVVREDHNDVTAGFESTSLAAEQAQVEKDTVGDDPSSVGSEEGYDVFRTDEQAHSEASQVGNQKFSSSTIDGTADLESTSLTAAQAHIDKDAVGDEHSSANSEREPDMFRVYDSAEEQAWSKDPQAGDQDASSLTDAATAGLGGTFATQMQAPIDMDGREGEHNSNASKSGDDVLVLHALTEGQAQSEFSHVGEQASLSPTTVATASFENISLTPVQAGMKQNASKDAYSSGVVESGDVASRLHDFADNSTHGKTLKAEFIDNVKAGLERTSLTLEQVRIENDGTSSEHSSVGVGGGNERSRSPDSGDEPTQGKDSQLANVESTHLAGSSLTVGPERTSSQERQVWNDEDAMGEKYGSDAYESEKDVSRFSHSRARDGDADFEGIFDANVDDGIESLENTNPARELTALYGQTAVTTWPRIDVWAGGNGKGTNATQLNYPYGGFFVRGTVAGTGLMYVSDTQNHRVQRWTVDPNFAPIITTVAGVSLPGNAANQLRFPKGIYVDSSNALYVADSGNHRVIKFVNGATVGVVVAGSRGALLNKQEAVIGFEPNCCRPGSKMDELQNPHGVFVDAYGRVFVADTGNNRVQRWAGQIATTVAGGTAYNGNINATLSHPEGVFIWKSDLYVADTGNERVMKWPENASVGVLVAGGFGRGSALNQLTNPTSVVVDDNLQEEGLRVEELYVCDTYNHRVMKYRLPGLWKAMSPAVVAGGCLQNPSYIVPCVGGGLHDPPRPTTHRIDSTSTMVIINPSLYNPPLYYFWGPSTVFVGYDGKNITVVDTFNHRVLTWVDYR